MRLESVQERFKSLKKKRMEVEIINRNVIVNEEKAKIIARKPQVYSMNEECPLDEETKNVERSVHRDRLLDYNIVEYEKWEEKVQSGSKLQDSLDAGTISYLSYKRGIRELEKSGRLVKDKIKNGKMEDSGKIVLEDDEDLVMGLSENLQETSRQRYLHRKKRLEKQNSKMGAVGKCVNYKNKRFNAKLSSQFKKMGC